MRDEAHRFAIQFNRKLRRKLATTSVLELIPGLGPARVRNLLRQFGSVAGVKAATEEQLRAADGMTARLALAVRQFFAEHEGAALGGPARDAGPGVGEDGIDEAPRVD